METKLCKHHLEKTFPYKCKKCGLDINSMVDLIGPFFIEAIKKEKEKMV